MNSVAWRPVKGFEGFYEVNDAGEIRSLTYNAGHGARKKRDTPKVLRKTKTTTGYWKVELSRPGEPRKSLKVHRLVAEAFIENPDKKPNIHHIDHNPLNNSVENLMWCTQKENIQFDYDDCTRQSVGPFKKQIEDLYIKTGMEVSDIAKKLNLDRGQVYSSLKKSGIRPNRRSKYGAEVHKLKKLFDCGATNGEIASIFGCPKNYVARRRYQFKKGLI